MAMSAEQNERLTRVGPGTPCGELMRRYWHPIAASAQLPRPGTRPVRILGEDLVLYRDRQAKLGLLEPHCAHRLAGLVFGQPDDAGLRCSYHGWLYDANGQCIDQPYETFADPRSTYKDRIRIKAYPVEEMGGLIFAYLGPKPRPLLPRWEPMVRADLKREVGISIIPGNWLQMVENSGDVSHIVYTHNKFSNYALEQMGRTDLQRHGQSTGVGGFRPVRQTENRTPFGYGGVIFPYTTVHDDEYHIKVPMDDTHTMYFYYMYYRSEDLSELGVEVADQDDSWDVPYFRVPVPGLDPEGHPEWDLLDSNSGQDTVMWYSQGGVSDRTREHLGQGDAQVVYTRAYLDEQIRVVEQGGEPVNVFRDPAANECIVAIAPVGHGSVLGRPLSTKTTADGRPDQTFAARKYATFYREAARRHGGDEALRTPVH